MARITVVLADLDGAARDVMATTEAWASRGLLSDSFWIDRQEGVDHATIIRASGEVSKVRTIDELAKRGDIEQLTIVALHVLGSEAEAASAPSARTDHELIRPLYERAAVLVDTDVLSLTVVAMATGVPFPTQAYDEAWHATLVVATEDRFADDHMADDVSPEELGPHAAGTVATATGMWSATVHTPLGAVDHALRQHGRGSIRLVRTSARFVDGGPFPDIVIDRVLTVDGSWPTPEGAKPASDLDRVVAWAADQVVEKHDLRYRPLRPPLEKRPQEIGLLDALKAYVRALLMAGRMMSEDAFRQGREEMRQLVASTAQKHLFGADADVRVVVGGRTKSGRVDPTSVEEQYHAVRSTGTVGTESPVATPEIWSDVRDIAVALIDGSDYPEGYETHRIGRAPGTVGDPYAVAPTPFGPTATFPTHELDSGAVIRSSDPRTATILERLLREQIAATAQTTEPENPATTRLQSLGRWKAQRERSFTWHIGAAIGNSAIAAGEELAAALDHIANNVPPTDGSEDDKALMRRQRRIILTAGAVAIIAIVVGAAGAAYDRWTWVQGLVGGGLVAGIAQLVGFLVYLGVARELARAMFRLRRQADLWVHAHERAAQAGRATTHFTSLYWQHLDWSEIIGGLVHRPWGRAQGEPVSHRLGDVRTTRSTLLATADPDRDRIVLAVTLGHRAVMTAGWLTAHVHRVEELSTKRYARSTGTPIDQVQPLHDTAPPGTVAVRDVAGEDVLSPRGSLHREVLTEHYAQMLRDEKAHKVLEAAFSPAPDELLGPVEVLGVGDALSGEPVSEFLKDVKATTKKIVFPLSMVADDPGSVSPETSVVLLPVSLAPELAAHTVTRTRLGQNLLYMACRLDISEGLLPTHLVHLEVPDVDVGADDGGLGDTPRPLL